MTPAFKDLHARFTTVSLKSDGGKDIPVFLYLNVLSSGNFIYGLCKNLFKGKTTIENYQFLDKKHFAGTSIARGIKGMPMSILF